MFPHSHQILCPGTAKPTGALVHAEVALQSCCHPVQALSAGCPSIVGVVYSWLEAPRKYCPRAILNQQGLQFGGYISFLLLLPQLLA